MHATENKTQKTFDKSFKCSIMLLTAMKKTADKTSVTER